MPVSFRILPDYGLVYVRYDGFAVLDETMQAFGEYAQHPEAHPGQKHLVDFSRVTGFEQDYVKLMQIQARKAGTFSGNGTQTLMVYYCPNDLSMDMSKLILRSWEGIDAVVPLILQHEDEALSVFGLKHRSFAELLAELD